MQSVCTHLCTSSGCFSFDKTCVRLRPALLQLQSFCWSSPACAVQRGNAVDSLKWKWTNKICISCCVFSDAGRYHRQETVICAHLPQSSREPLRRAVEPSFWNAEWAEKLRWVAGGGRQTSYLHLGSSSGSSHCDSPAVHRPLGSSHGRVMFLFCQLGNWGSDGVDGRHGVSGGLPAASAVGRLPVVVIGCPLSCT